MKKLLTILLIAPLLAIAQSPPATPQTLRDLTHKIPTSNDTTHLFFNGTDYNTSIGEILNLVVGGTNYQTTIAGLRAMTAPSSSVSYYVTDLGMQGFWYYDPLDNSSTDNQGTILVSSNGKRFKRIYQNATVQAAWFGAKGDDATNCMAAVNSAIQYLGPIGGGTVELDYGIFDFWNITAATWYDDKPRILINWSNIHLRGKSEGGTICKFYGRNRTDPNTNYDTINDPSNGGTVYVREPAIMIKSQASEEIHDTWITDMTLDGLCAMTKDAFFPAFPGHTNDWDISHKGVYWYADGTTRTDNSYVLRVHVHNFLGETFYSGGNMHKLIHIESCTADSSNASLYSLGGHLEIINNRGFAGLNGLECYPGPGRNLILNNDMEDMYSGAGYHWGGATTHVVDSMTCEMSGNVSKRNPQAGYFFDRQIRGVMCHNNYSFDDGVGIRIEPQNDFEVNDLKIFSNFILAEKQHVPTGIGFFGNGVACNGVDIYNNTIGVSHPAGVTNNVHVTTAIAFYNTNGDIRIHGNTADGYSYGYVNSASAAGVVFYPVAYDNKYLNQTYFTTTNVMSGSVTIEPLENYTLFDSADVAANIDIVMTTTKIKAGTRMKLINPNNNTKWNFPTGGIYLIKNAVLLGKNDYVMWEFNGSKYELVRTSAL